MNFNIRQSFEIFLKNPQVMLLFVMYLLILASLFPLLIYTFNTISFYIVAFVFILFACAFFAGWFGMIKFVILNNDEKSPEEELKIRHNSFKNAFFESVAKYILPVLFFILLIIGYIYGINKLADLFFGKPVDILNQMTMLNGDTDALYNFASTIPKDALKVIVERNIFRYLALLLYGLITFYSIPSLFFNEKNNPLLALKNGLVALFKKPFQTLFLFLTIVLIHILLVFFDAISTTNQVLMFIALVVRVSFFAYIIVLIFNVYEKNFTLNNNNGADSIGQN